MLYAVAQSRSYPIQGAGSRRQVSFLHSSTNIARRDRRHFSAQGAGGCDQSVRETDLTSGASDVARLASPEWHSSSPTASWFPFVELNYPSGPVALLNLAQRHFRCVSYLNSLGALFSFEQTSRQETCVDQSCLVAAAPSGPLAPRGVAHGDTRVRRACSIEYRGVSRNEDSENISLVTGSPRVRLHWRQAALLQKAEGEIRHMAADVKS
jgi:hypothetical protein